MKLREFIEIKKIARIEAAKELDCTVAALGYWMNGKRIPRPEMIKRIDKWSGGKVAPPDWY